MLNKFLPLLIDVGHHRGGFVGDFAKLQPGSGLVVRKILEPQKALLQMVEFLIGAFRQVSHPPHFLGGDDAVNGCRQ